MTGAHLPTNPLPHPPTTSPELAIQSCEVHKLFLKQNCRKAAGPDKVSPAILKHCADQLAPVFSNIFNESLQECHVPKCFKDSIIVPIPKKTKVTSLNDYRPVALTSVAMKVFERLILLHLKACTDPKLDPNQFAYRANRSTDDAVALGLHHILKHLEASGTYARILFVDYSSAFNTIPPKRLHQKLSDMGVGRGICDWVLDFLSDRSQRVRIGDKISDTLILNVGAPQGCVLSPSLFTLYTNDCVSSDPSVKLIKFSDDTTLKGLISKSKCEKCKKSKCKCKCEKCKKSKCKCKNEKNGSNGVKWDESAYMKEIERLSDWCDENALELNAKKTEEMVIDFRKKTSTLEPVFIHGQRIQQVTHFKFLGTTISNSLKWDDNCRKVLSKARQRLYFLRQLRKFRVGRAVMLRFYRAVVESILTSSITVWFGNAAQHDRDLLQGVVDTASRIVGCQLPSLEALYSRRMIGRARKIVHDPDHPANHLFEPLPSGRRFRSIRARTSRFRDSFFPTAVRTINP